MAQTKEQQELAEKRLRYAAKSIGDVEIPSSLLADIAGKAEKELEKRAEDVDIIKITELKDDIENAQKDYGKETGLTTGLDIIDKMIGGLKPAETTIICANSNVGKSWLAADMAILCAYQVPTLFITLEMRAEQLGTRMKIYLDKVNGKTDNWTDGCDMYFQKAKTLDYRSIKKLFEVATDKGIKAVFLDYLQYLGVGMDAKEMEKISRMFHELALVHNIPIVIVASLRKDTAGYSRHWSEVEDTDVKGVGAIVYDCDNLLCCGRSDPETKEDTPESFWVKHIKSRNMPRDIKYPYGKMKWEGGTITNDNEWFKEVGQYYGHIDSRPIKTDLSNSWVDDIKDEDIKPITEFEQRKLGLFKKGN